MIEKDGVIFDISAEIIVLCTTIFRNCHLPSLQIIVIKKNRDSYRRDFQVAGSKRELRARN